MTNTFRKATKENIKLRMALYGPPGCGKTYTALQLASILGKRIGLIDTEYGSSRKYANLFNFDVLELTKFGPSQYYNAIEAAEELGFDYLIIDSLSHAWYAQLDAVGGDVRNWAKIRPIERQLWDKISSSKCHIIATMRSKIEYEFGTNEVGGKSKISGVKKIGTAPIQKDGSEYEMDICGLMDDVNTLNITKSRCPEISGGVYPSPGKKFAEIIKKWLSETTRPERIQEAHEILPWEPTVKIIPQSQEQAIATLELITSNGHVEAIAKTNGHIKEAHIEAPITASVQVISKPDNPAKLAFKALMAVTKQQTNKVIECSIELYGADPSGLKPKFSSENMTAIQIKAVCEALLREWLGNQGYTAELAQDLIDISSSRHQGQYGEIAKDIEGQLNF